MSIDASALRQVNFLEPVNDKSLRRLADSMTERVVGAGEDVVTEGTVGIAFFVVLDGTLSVVAGGTEVRKLLPGDHFGELSLVLPDVPRTATVRADTEARVGALTQWNFKGFLEEHPEVHWPLLVNLARQLADRG